MGLRAVHCSGSVQEKQLPESLMWIILTRDQAGAEQGAEQGVEQGDRKSIHFVILFGCCG